MMERNEPMPDHGAAEKRPAPLWVRILFAKIPMPRPPRPPPEAGLLFKIEVRKKCPMAALLLSPWLLTLLVLHMGAKSYYGTHYVALVELALPAIVGFCLLYAFVLGSSTFQNNEKDGIRFFLYHHPASRAGLFLVRCLTGLLFLAFLCTITVLFTPRLLGTSWEAVMDNRHAETVLLVLPFYVLLGYSAAAFFSPLFVNDFLTIPMAIVYIFAVAPLVRLIVGIGILLWPLAIVVAGAVLFRRRRTLEQNWLHRFKKSLLYTGVSLLVLVALGLLRVVDFVDLLYLIGIDLLKYGG